MEFKIRARRGDICFGPDKIRLYAFQFDDKTHYCAEPLKFQATERYVATGPFIDIDSTEAQQLIDDLWDCGVRPSEGSGSAGALKAVQNHLADLKKVLFHTLKIKE
jgi:hypothetical protein